jgi:quercetin dioxygenase-like cupin family protein
MDDKVVVRGRDEGTPLWMLGSVYEVKAAGAETGGTLSAVEMRIPAGKGPPPHVHDCAELQYIIEGTARYQVDGRTFEAGPGTILYFPKDTLGTFEPTSEMRLLAIYAPGGTDKSLAKPPIRPSRGSRRRLPKSHPNWSGRKRSPPVTAPSWARPRPRRRSED